MSDELDRRGEERRLIFQNVANGVPIEQVMAAFRRSETEVWSELRFVAKKIAEYRFRRQQPPLACDSLKDIRWNRLALLETVAKLGPRYLSSDLIIPNIEVQALDHPSMLREAAQRSGVRVI